MRVLVACEYSGTVRDAFLAAGHDAYSCDILPTESRPERHFQASAIEIAYSQAWDLMIAHPPCTYLTYAGAGNWNDEGREEKRLEAMDFFTALYNAPIRRIAIENPRGYPSESFRRQDQEINPFDFGVPVRKRICLWLKGLPPLVHTEQVEAPILKTYIRKTGARAGKPYNTYFHQGKSAKERARFFPCVAQAMAEQWGSL